MRHIVITLTIFVILTNVTDICVIAHDISMNPIAKVTKCIFDVAFILFCAYIMYIYYKDNDHR